MSTEKKESPRLPNLSDILEYSLNEIFLFDAESLHFVYVNKGARDNLGYTMDELRAMTPADIKPEFTPAAFQMLLDPLRSEQKKKLEFVTVHQRKDGSKYPVEVHLQRSRYDSTPVFAALILDITERLQTHEALAQARLFLESSPDATIVVNPAGEIEFANSQTARLFGYAHDELRGMSIEKLVPERFRAGHAAHRQEYGVSPKFRGMGADLDLHGVTSGGKEIPIEVSLSPIETGGGTLVAAAIRDVSVRRENERLLEQAKDIAENATATKSRFLAAASHDLRQPMQSIGLYLSVLDRLIDQPKAHEVTAKIRSSLDVMAELLDAFLDISKLDSGSVTPSRKNFSIQTMFDQLQAENEPLARNKGLEFRCGGADCVLHTDPVLLQRIVENFVGNAIRYTESGGVEVNCRLQDDIARIEVKDTGLGIPEEALGTIFEEYFQLDNPVRDRRKGLGLGLSIVKHIARLLDHRLDVSSTLGKGSTFSVEVPLGDHVEKSPQLPAETTVTKESRAPVVFFVDDDPAIIDATAMLFDVSGLQAHYALNGDEALAYLADGIRPDIVISDYRLPNYNGVELIKRIRSATVDDLPTVLMTGDTSSEEIAAANLSNCTVLHKPVNTEQLVAMIRNIDIA